MKQEHAVTPQLVKEHGLTEKEFERIKEMQGREPNFTELGLFSVMWSEHCSYKNSKLLLKNFPKGNSRMLVGAGEENAGIVDIGDGFAVSFKIESHNHPSAIEPFQGAATGVGGIIRDIFTMGARPIALLNSLRFGNPKNPKTKTLFEGVVSGIAHYGNCMGIPTVGGEVYFEECYDTNPLVNAMCLGVMKHEDIAKGTAKGIGNSVMYVGAATGRDGIHGATFASEDLTAESEKKRPAVQVGDPFMQKLLLEACLELYKTGFVVGVQDMGAAGLACSTTETASRGHSGLDVDLALVPQRETGMIPYEILCSESQERMLVIVHRGKEEAVEKIFEKWDLHAVKIGEVIEGEEVIYRFHGKIVARVKAKDLTENAPLNLHPIVEPAYFKENQKITLPACDPQRDWTKDLLLLMGTPNIASKRRVYEQYDHQVQTNTVVLPGSDAAVVRIRESKRSIAMSVDCNSRYVYCDPYRGAMIAVAESARNVICSGAQPWAISNCLNFGNPYNSEVYWQLKNSIDGISKAVTVFGTPVTGGNVSLYNQNPKGAVYPTPTIVMIGVVQDSKHITQSFFKNENDAIYLVGHVLEELLCSEYAKCVFQQPFGPPPKLDIEEAHKIHQFVLKVIQEGLVSSAHDCSEGGLAVTLAECCFSPENPIGADIDIPYSITRPDAALFGETQNRFVLSIPENARKKIESTFQKNEIPFHFLGFTGGKTLRIRHQEKTWIDAPISAFYKAHKTGLDFLF
jgi:phosphoribosylformylglycinamidine synthase